MEKGIKWYINCFVKVIANGENPRNLYNSKNVYIPCIVCKDDFRIGVSVNTKDMVKTYNGYGWYGEDWLFVNWYYPNMPIDAIKFNSEEEDTTQSVGVVAVDLFDELLNEHGGIDLEKTLDWYLQMV